MAFVEMSGLPVVVNTANTSILCLSKYGLGCYTHRFYQWCFIFGTKLLNLFQFITRRFVAQYKFVVNLTNKLFK